jgi:hypothetical protein
VVCDAQRIGGEETADAEGHTFVLRTFKRAGLYRNNG